jgi:toxin-antitoxin system PIN domain toxin
VRLVDVNVLAFAFRSDTPQHKVGRHVLDTLLADTASFGLSEFVLSGFLRLVTHPRVYKPPTPLAAALAFAETLRSAPNCAIVRPGYRYWPIFTDVCRRSRATGNDIPDACLAALAIEHDCEFITGDQYMGRFPGLRWRYMLAPGFSL